MMSNGYTGVGGYLTSDFGHAILGTNVANVPDENGIQYDFYLAVRDTAGNVARKRNLERPIVIGFIQRCTSVFRP
jgi:hypothetical protein